MTCSKCLGELCVKNGNRDGKQCYLCKACGRQFTGDHEHVELEKRAAITLEGFGLSMRKIGDVLGYSHVTIMNWLRDFKERASKAIESYFMGIDEVRAFLGEDRLAGVL